MLSKFNTTKIIIIINRGNGGFAVRRVASFLPDRGASTHQRFMGWVEGIGKSYQNALVSGWHLKLKELMRNKRLCLGP